jgi:rhodanese-related sulfurtransferase
MRKGLICFLFISVWISIFLSNGCAGTVTAPVEPTIPGVTQPASSPSGTPPPNSTPALTAAITAADTAISVQDAFTLIQQNKSNPDFVIIDVRTADEFNSGHLEGAVNIDFYSPDFKANLDKLERNKEYLIYCRTGIRGAAAIRIMLDIGFTMVRNMSGGIVQWNEAGYPTVK